MAKRSRHTPVFRRRRRPGGHDHGDKTPGPADAGSRTALKEASLMATNLLQLISNAVTPDTVQGLSTFLGEKDSAVQGGITTLLPVLLGGMARMAIARLEAAAVSASRSVEHAMHVV